MTTADAGDNRTTRNEDLLIDPKGQNKAESPTIKTPHSSETNADDTPHEDPTTPTEQKRPTMDEANIATTATDREAEQLHTSTMEEMSLSSETPTNDNENPQTAEPTKHMTTLAFDKTPTLPTTPPNENARDTPSETNAEGEEEEDQEPNEDEESQDLSDPDYQFRDDDDEEASSWNSDDYEKEDQEIQVPPVPEPTQAKLSFSVIQLRAEFISPGKFVPIVQIRELLHSLMKHPSVLGCATPDNVLITPRTFPTTEVMFNSLARTDFCQLSRQKHKMSVVFDLATKDSLDIMELKTKEIIQYLQEQKISLDSHRYDDIATAEIGIFIGMHEKITNRNNLHEFIADYHETVHDEEAPEFEIYEKNVYCRHGHDRAFARVLAIKSGRSDAANLQDFLCVMAKRKAFGQAEFIPQGVHQTLLTRKLTQQNKYVSNTTAFPIIGLNREILSTEVTAGHTKLPFREYIVKCMSAEKLEPKRFTDRWLLVLPKTEQDKAIKFMDNDMVKIFTEYDLPRHPLHDIPYRPGSQVTKSPIFKEYTDIISHSECGDEKLDKQYSRPPLRQPQSRLAVSYATAAAQSTKKLPPTLQLNPKIQKTTPTKTIQSVRQSVRAQIANNSKELQADLTSQVMALQSQISALQGLVASLQQQIQALTLPTNTTTTTTTTTAQPNGTIDMELSTATTSPRERAHKRPRSNNQSAKDTSAADDKFEDSPQDSSTNANLTQPTPPIDPNHGLDPGEEDSTLL